MEPPNILVTAAELLWSPQHCSLVHAIFNQFWPHPFFATSSSCYPPTSSNQLDVSKICYTNSSNRPRWHYNNNNNNNNNNKCVKRETSQCCGIKQCTETEKLQQTGHIIIKNKKEKTCTLIDVAIPADRNVVQKEAEKKLKYKSLCIEIQRMWNLKCTIVPVIIGAIGIVTRT